MKMKARESDVIRPGLVSRLMTKGLLLKALLACVVAVAPCGVAATVAPASSVRRQQQAEARARNRRQDERRQDESRQGESRQGEPRRLDTFQSDEGRDEVVRFARLGEVRVRAIVRARRLPRLEFTRATTGRRLLTVTVGTSDPELFRPDPTPSPANPFVRFMKLDAEGIPGPLIFAVAIRPGGSDHTFETTIIGESGARLKVFTPQPFLTPIQGGVFIGQLGGRRGLGAAVWQFLWGDDEAHYAAHRYEVQLYRFNPRTRSFVKGPALRSRNKHESGQDALVELGLPRYTNLLDNFPAITDYRN